MPKARLESELHAALRRQPASLAEVRDVVHASDGQARLTLVNAKSAEGVTPLMLAVQVGGGGRRRQNSPEAREAAEIVRFLLESGATLSVAAHGKSRRTAADYAAAHGKAELAERLKALEISALAACGEAAARTTCSEAAARREPRLRCGLCGDQFGPNKLALAHERARRDEEPNPLLAGFWAEPRLTPARLEVLCAPALHSFTQRGGFTREFTEVAAMLRALKAIVRPDGAAGAAGAAAATEAEPWHVIDLCCSKSFLATLVAVLYPEFRVTAIDRVDERFLPHFGAAGISNITYLRRDVEAAGFADECSRLSEDGRTIVLGMHLCGTLSLRALDLFRSLPNVHALVLAPCCLPNARAAEDTPACVYERGIGQAAQFDRWCAFLEAKAKAALPRAALAVADLCAAGLALPGLARAGPPAGGCRSEVVAGVVSEKRTLISATKHAKLQKLELPTCELCL